MFTARKITAPEQRLFWLASVAALMLLSFSGVLAVSQEEGQQTFTTPQDADKALYDGAKAADKDALLKVLGSSASGVLSSGDEVQDKQTRDFFTERYEQMHRWGKEANGTLVLYVGAENWPFPMPLTKASSGAWFFDSKNGAEEILYRRIGKNELATMRVSKMLFDAQKQYFEQSHDGDATHQYAQKVLSDPGKQNGLYWKVEEGQPESPIGPLVAYATGEGYGGQHDTPQPFHGYFYKIVNAQGANAKGGAKNYIVNGKMTAGFAVLAYPAEYRNSGVMTFMFNQDGILYEKDLGENTAEVAGQIKAFNPDSTWDTVTEDDYAAAQAEMAAEQ